jgi:transcriptional regulator with XRE-family HTH domain
MPPKEICLTVRVRNNRLRERRLAAGLTIKQLAKLAKVHFGGYTQLENMYQSPRMKNGQWRNVARRMARYYRLPIEELFPVGVEAVKHARVVRKIDAAELGPLLANPKADPLLLPEGTKIRNDSLRNELDRAVDGIPVPPERQ